MIITRAPLRISFVGGGTDLPGFYRRLPGRVVSATIDKFTYVALNSTPLIDELVVKYQRMEIVRDFRELEHPSIKAALSEVGISSGGLEIGSFGDLPSKTGLGSSSSFLVALLNGLHTYLGRKLSRAEAAELACKIEIEVLKEPIGKQDQYAAAFGGFNLFQFNPNESVDIEPILLNHGNCSFLEKHLMLFFTGITRFASSVLADQSSKINDNFEMYKIMAESVFEFRRMLISGDIRAMAEMLNEGWARKKTLARTISNNIIDAIYERGMKAGAWGGKVLGAGGGGCILFFVPAENQDKVRDAMAKTAVEHRQLSRLKQIPFKFAYSGSEVIFNNSN